MWLLIFGGLHSTSNSQAWNGCSLLWLKLYALLLKVNFITRNSFRCFTFLLWYIHCILVLLLLLYIIFWRQNPINWPQWLSVNCRVWCTAINNYLVQLRIDTLILNLWKVNQIILITRSNDWIIHSHSLIVITVWHSLFILGLLAC